MNTTTFHLLTVTGKVKPTSIAATCELHNNTAGHPDGVAAAKQLGDLSHMTFMSLDAEKNYDGKLLFLDVWNNLEGMNNFFSDPQVKGGADLMLETREAVVWNKLNNFTHFSLPAPTGKNNRIVGMIRGTVKSMEEAERVHNAMIEKNINIARQAGLISHDFYCRLAAPGSTEALEILGVDVWMDAEGMMGYYSGEVYQNAGLNQIFSAKPSSSIWVHPKGEWVEW